jgi:hydroxyacyl-ACP dehydratase HTD2-like protein with hotdog domain
MDIAEIEGKTYGPRPLRVAVDSVADFLEVTNDNPARWADEAPPGYAAAALFVVAPELLEELSDRSIIHGEQSFAWHAPIAIGSLLDVTGRVTKARERGGVYFVTFEIEATGPDGPVLTGSSLFLISGEAIPAESDFLRPEPPHSYRGAPEDGEMGASRADLIRYAAATRDWNPIHWDHDAAVAAGFPGVVVHGLLQAAWVFAIASSGSESSRPLVEARVRFRNPLLPARPVKVRLAEGKATVADETTEYLTATIVTAGE